MTALAAWLWQGLLLAASVELFLRARPRLNAATRHLIWWAACAGVVALGLIHGAWTGPSSPAAPSAAAAGGPLLRLPAAPAWLVWGVFGAWLGFAVLGLGRVLRGLRHVGALRAHAVPLDAARASRLVTWRRTRGGGRQAGLLVTDRPVAACALGFRRPAILLSQRLVAALDGQALDQVVMHEQAHLDRFDDWLRIAQAVVTALAGIHPAIHFIGRRIDLEREAACDDRVVCVTGAAARYAACLTDAAMAASAHLPAAVPSVFGGSSSSVRSLRTRILRLVSGRPDHGRRFARLALATVAVWLAAVLVSAPLLPAVVVFAHDARRTLAMSLAPVAFSSVIPAAPAALPAEAADESSAVKPSGNAERPARGQGAAARSDRGDEPGNRPGGRLPSQPPPPAAPRGASAVNALAGDTTAALDSLTLIVADTPPEGTEAGLPRAGAASPGAETSPRNGSFPVIRNSVATARTVGQSLAGTFTRAGKAFGKVF